MSATSLILLNDRLVVEPIEKEQRIASGLVLPDTAKEKPQQGKVLAVGPGRRDKDGKRIVMDVSVDDVVLFAVLLQIMIADFKQAGTNETAGLGLYT